MEAADPISQKGHRVFAITVAAIAFAVLAMAVLTLPEAKRQKPLRVGFNEFSPYVFMDSEREPSGFAVDVMREAAARSGQSLVWIPVDDAERSLNDGNIDIYPLLTVTRERLTRFHFSDYWWQNSLELVSSQQHPINRVSDVADRTVGLRMNGLVVKVASSLLPSVKLVVKPNFEALFGALCSGEVDAAFADGRSITRELVENPPPCTHLKLKMTPVPGATLAQGTASTLMARNRADLLYAHINEVVADGTLANLASRYMLVTPDSNQQLAQVVQDRERDLVLEVVLVGVCGLLVLFIFLFVRMRSIERAAAEARLSLEESEQRFHAFMDNAASLAFMRDSDGRMVYGNQAYWAMMKAKPDERLGKTNFDLMPAAIAAELHANDQVVLDSNCGRQFTESVPDPAGVMHHWLSHKFPFRGRNGQVFLGGVSIEITEMLRVQDALRESESRYRQIVEYAGDIIIRCDGRGRVTYVNEMGARVLRMTPDQLRGKRALSLIPSGERAHAFRRLREELVSGRGDDFYIELPVTTGDGKEIWLGQTVRLLRSVSGSGGLQAISRDITERRRIEAELRASEERFRVLYENGPVAYHEIDREGVIRQVNPAECDLLGRSADDLMGRSIIDMLVPEERPMARAAIRAKVSEQLALRPFQRNIQRPDGRQVRVEIHEKLLRDQNQQVIGIHSVLLDVTQRHLAEMLERDRGALIEMIVQQKPLDRILAGISQMISHQNETFCCIPVQFASPCETVAENPAWMPVLTDAATARLCDAIEQQGNHAFPIREQDPNIRQVNVDALMQSPESRGVGEAAVQLGLHCCWPVPVVSSCRRLLGVLLVFAPRDTDASGQEKQLMESAGRTAAIAMEHRYLTDLMAFQASHDSLTRLPNRRSFESGLALAICKAAANDGQLAVFYIDLDRFKEINDTFGHCGGDNLLLQVAGRLRRSVRETDLVGRVGGDEFSILVTGLRDPSDGDRVASAVLRAFQAPFDISGSKISVTASIGVSLYPRDGADVQTLQRNSDTAMYRVKRSGRNNYRCYPELGAGTRLENVELLVS